MFTTIFIQPVFNVLVLIYALIPGHNFGLALILFTVLTRLVMWPLIKKQLHQAKAMRKLQPELKKIKKQAAGDRAKESALMMALYKERGINPFGQIGTLAIQLPVFIALYSGISRIVGHHDQMVSFSYPWIRQISWMKELAADVTKFDNSLFGIVDLDRAAQGPGGWYFPALVIVVLSAILQYFVSKQLMPSSSNSKSLRGILKEAKSGQMTDQTDINAAVSRNMLIFIPLLIGFVTLRVPAALGLYLLVGSIVAYIQQSYVLGQDEVELVAIADGKEVTATLEVPDDILPPRTHKKHSKKGNKKSRRR